MYNSFPVLPNRIGGYYRILQKQDHPGRQAGRYEVGEVENGSFFYKFKYYAVCKLTASYFRIGILFGIGIL
jgi:hypothetical protein